MWQAWLKHEETVPSCAQATSKGSMPPIHLVRGLLAPTPMKPRLDLRRHAIVMESQAELLALCKSGGLQHMITTI